MAFETVLYGVQLIADERWRQIEKEGYTPEHDDEHTDGIMASAASIYALPEKEGDVLSEVGWTAKSKSKYTRERQLVIAGALIAAELDRLHRAEQKAAKTDG